jgi:hypothetical protein
VLEANQVEAKERLLAEMKARTEEEGLRASMKSSGRVGTGTGDGRSFGIGSLSIRRRAGRDAAGGLAGSKQLYETGKAWSASRYELGSIKEL